MILIAIATTALIYAAAFHQSSISTAEPADSAPLGVEGARARAAQAASGAGRSSGKLRDTFPEEFQYCDKAECTRTLKVIAMALYGSDPRYTVGVVKNSKIVREAFPDWQLWVYTAQPGVKPELDVPVEVLDKIRSNGGKIISLDATTIGNLGFGMNWRFLVADNTSVARFAIRDSDTRLLLRDRYAMDAWEASGQPFHVMRDHPGHGWPMLGGLWGGSTSRGRSLLPDMHKAISAVASDKKHAYLNDMEFLQDKVWPTVKAKGVLQHDVFTCHETERWGRVGHPFPTERGGSEVVGAVYDGEDAPRKMDVDLLPRNVPSKHCATPPMPAGARHNLCMASPSASGGAHAGDSGCAVATAAAEAPAAVVQMEGQALVAAYEASKVFVDALDPDCTGSEPSKLARNGTKPAARKVAPAGSGPALPVIFSYDAVHRFGAQRHEGSCPPPPAGRVPQYHERFKYPDTHFSAFRPHGVQYHRLLVVLDQVYGTGDMRFMLAEGLPALAYALARLPDYARVLLPDTPEMDKLMSASARLPRPPLYWRRAPATAAVLDSWRSVPWAAPHRAAPSLSWAHRLLAVTSNVAPLRSLRMRGELFVDARGGDDAFDAAHLAVAAAAYTLHAADARGPGPARAAPPAPTCSLLVMGDAAIAVYRAAFPGGPPAGWAAEELPTDGAHGPEQHAAALQRAAALVLDPEAPPLMLAYARRGASLVWVWRDEPGWGGAAAASEVQDVGVCSLGTVACTHTGPRGRKDNIEKALAGAACGAGAGAGGARVEQS